MKKITGKIGNWELGIGNSNHGYTILETMIAVSVFLVVVTSGIGALLNANLIHQKSQDMRSIMDSLSFIMEDMSRNMRTGYNFRCFTSGDSIPFNPPSGISQPKSCENGWGLAFETANGSTSNENDQWVYYIEGSTGKLFKSTTGPYVSGNFTQMNPDEVVISGISGFSVLGATGVPADNQQPFVIIRIVGTITYKDVTTPFSLQTSVSQRLVDI